MTHHNDMPAQHFGIFRRGGGARSRRAQNNEQNESAALGPDTGVERTAIKGFAPAPPRRWDRNRTALLFVACFLFLSLLMSQFNYMLYWPSPSTDSSKMILPHDEDPPQTESFSVDILSVGSLGRLDLVRAQQESFQSHESVRNFFVVTENDDQDPECADKLTWDEVKAVSRHCRWEQDKNDKIFSPVFSFFRSYYANAGWLKIKSNPTGWLCAQVRPMSGLFKAFKHFNLSKQVLPDYFIIMDDDTYYDMELLMQNLAGKNSLEALVYAGCLINRTFSHPGAIVYPYGGYGSIISKGALRNFFEPIHCPPRINSAYQHLFCRRLDENNVGEKQSFIPGMNLVELMFAYVNRRPYRDLKFWSNDKESQRGYCMHSDMTIGYFVQHYSVPNQVADQHYANLPQSRIVAYKGSEIQIQGTNKTSKKSRFNYTFKGFCGTSWQMKCGEGSGEVCHYATAEWFRNVTDKQRQPAGSAATSDVPQAREAITIHDSLALATAQGNVPSSVSAIIVPNVLLVGAQKAGSSAVANWLSSLKSTCYAQTFDNEPFWYSKEVHFFDKQERFKHGKEFYARRFEHCGSSDLVVDATPDYATFATRIGDFYRQLRMISSANGHMLNLKIMLILREPVSRELSAYNHKKFNTVTGSGSGSWALKRNYSSFDEYVDEEKLSDRGFYSTQLRQWFRVLKRDQILILSYHELKRDPTTFQRRIADFLGLPPNSVNSTMESANDSSFTGKEVLSCRTRNKLGMIFQPHNEDLYALLTQNPGPPMEQRPFPEFEVAACKDNDGDMVGLKRSES